MDKNVNFDTRLQLDELQSKIAEINTEVSKVLVGKQNLVDLLIVAILAKGHVLLEGVPGIAKTMMAKLVAKLIAADFSRIQFTPDLMPSDVTGTTVYNVSNSQFEFNKGPIFSNMVLIDEINRAPAKTQAALFEVMEEYQVSVDGTTYPMDAPFIVLATQNPLEHEGTYRLPEAQLDRFMFKIIADYPSLDEEVIILQQAHDRKDNDELSDVQQVLSKEDIIKFRSIIKEVQIDEKLIQYIAQIIHITRRHPSLYLGASPRASINAMNAAKAYAAINGRDYVIPEDIKQVIAPVLIHRINLTAEKELEGFTEKDVVKEIINSIEVPR